MEWRANVSGSLEMHILVESLSEAACLKNKKPELVSTVSTPPGLIHYPSGSAVGSLRAREHPVEKREDECDMPLAGGMPRIRAL